MSASQVEPYGDGRYVTLGAPGLPVKNKASIIDPSKGFQKPRRRRDGVFAATWPLACGRGERIETERLPLRTRF